MNIAELLTHMNDISEREMEYRSETVHTLSSFYRYLDEHHFKDENGIYFMPQEILRIPSEDEADFGASGFFWDRLKGKASRFVIKKATRFYREPFSYADFIAMRYVYSGHCHMFMPQNEIILNEGDLIMLNPNFIMSQELGENDHVFTMMFDKNYIRDVVLKGILSSNDISQFLINYVLDTETSQKYLLFHSASNIRVRQTFEEILCEQIDPSPYGDELMAALLRILMIRLLHCPYEYSDENRRNTKRIAGILNYVDLHYHTVTLNDLASKFGYSEKYISRLFLQAAGISFKNYVFRLKYEEICMKLKNTDLSIEEILKQVNITSETYFYNQFRKQFGLSPAEYRNKNNH